jgi:predicted nucleic acid-binding protein
LIVLDSWALLAYLKDENSANRIESAWIEEGATICSINLGEVLYIRMRGDGEDAAAADIDRVRQRLDVVDPDWPLISEAAKVKAHGGLSYADAFCLATAFRVEAPLWTGDPEIVDRAAEHSCAVVDLRAPTG